MLARNALALIQQRIHPRPHLMDQGKWASFCQHPPHLMLGSLSESVVAVVHSIHGTASFLRRAGAATDRYRWSQTISPWSCPPLSNCPSFHNTSTACGAVLRTAAITKSAWKIHSTYHQVSIRIWCLVWEISPHLFDIIQAVLEMFV